MSLALLTLSLLVVAPARAGHWVVTYECSGSSSYMKVPEDQPKTTTGPFPNNWPTTFDSTTQCPPGADDYSPIYYYYPGYLGVDPDSDTRLLLSSASNSGSMVAVLTWTADSATDPSLPPLNVNVIETAQVVAAVDAQGHTPSVAVSDSFGDVPTPIATGDGWNNYGLMASGQHLLTLDNSSGQQVIRLPKRSFSATASGTPDSNGFQENFSQADVTYTVAPDTHARDVTITCPAVDTYADGGSQYRYPALTGPVIVNVRQSDGTLRGDTANYSGFSNGGTILSYTGSPTGSWAAGSQYHWNSSLTGNSASGTWPNIYNFSVGEPYGPGVQKFDHIFISLYDAGDGTEATGNYWMYFHDPYEPTSYPEDGGYPQKQTTQIDSDVPSWPTYSWHAEVNPQTGTIDSEVGPLSAGSQFLYSGTEAQSWHLDGGLGISAEPVDAHFGGGYDKDIVNTTSGSSIAIPLALPAGYKTWAVYRQDIKRHKGHLDVYGIHGYTFTGVWYRDENIGTERSVYYPYVDATTVNAHDPDPNWNPGGS